MEIKKDINLFHLQREKKNLFLVWIFLIFSILLGLEFGTYHKKQQELSELNQTLIQLSNKKQNVTDNLQQVIKVKQESEMDMEKMKGETERAVKILSGLNERRLWSDFLLNLSNKVPEGAWFSNVTSQQGKDNKTHEFVINGFAKNNNAIASFVSELEMTDDFSNISLSYVRENFNKDAKKTFYDFQIITVINENKLIQKRVVF